MHRQNKVKYIISLLVILNCLSAKAAVTNLVEPVKFFTNHDLQFNKVSNQFLTYNQVGIVGISGMGKTQLARMYAYKHKEQYDIIWFFDCKVDLAEQFAGLAKIINSSFCKSGGCNLSDTVDTSQKSVIEYLTPQKNWLLVFDNLTINQNQKIKDIIEWQHNGHVILCSQDAKDLPAPIRMTTFDLKDSIEILTKLMENRKADAIGDLAKIFKGNPVLTVKAGLFLKDNKYMSSEEYKNILAKSNNQVQTHVELVIKQLNEPTKDFLNKIALLNNQKISKNIMEYIIADKSDLTEILYNLTRFDIITNTNDAELVFEMHDIIKDAVLELASEKINQKNANELLDRFNNITPPKEGSLHRYSTISKDDAMISNHEALLEKAEKYNANPYKIMELRKTLMDFYGINKDHLNCKRMTTWLKEQEEKKVFDVSLMNNDTKAAYSWYLALMGMYEDSIYFNKAKVVLQEVKDYPRMETGVYDIIALTEISRGNIAEAEEIIPIIEKINAQNLGEVNANRLLYVKARIFLAQGNYKEALNFINKVITAEQDLMQHSSGGIYYVLKAEILNYLQNFQEAYQIMTELYKKEHDRSTNEYLLARILTQLARSELGLNKTEEAMSHASLVEKILLTKPENATPPQDSKDTELASILAVIGDISAATNNFKEAIEYYETAEKIYRNAYKTNFGHLDNVSYLLLQGVKSSVKLNDKFWYKHFSSTLKRLFPIDHHRVKELLDYKLSKS